MAIKNLSRRGRALTAVGAGCVAAGVLAASAASLGELTVNDLGTTSNVVASCQTTGLSLTGWAPGYSGVAAVTTPTSNTGSSYWVETPILTGISSLCESQSFKFVLASSTGAALTEISGSIGAAASQNLTLDGKVDSKSIYQATLTIYE